MKLNKISIISLILISFFLLSPVLASEDNMTVEVELIENDELNEVIAVDESVNQNNENILEDDSNNITGSEKLNLKVRVLSQYINKNNTNTFGLYSADSIYKDIKVQVDDILINDSFEQYSDDEEPTIGINFKELGLEKGTHNITFSYPGGERFEKTTVTYQFELVNLELFIPEVDFSDEWYYPHMFVDATDDESVITVYINKKFHNQFKIKDYDGPFYSYGCRVDLNNLTYGLNEITVNCNGSFGNYSTTEFLKYSYIVTDIYDVKSPWRNTEVEISAPQELSGKIFFKIANQTYKITLKNSVCKLTIDKKFLKLGSNPVIISCEGNNEYPAITSNYTINIVPDYYFNDEINSNDDESIIIKIPENINATYKILKRLGKYNFVLDYEVLSNGTLKNGLIHLPKLKTGNQEIIIELNTTDEIFKESFEIYVSNTTNSKNFKSSINSKTIKYGQYCIVKIKSPKINSKATIKIDNNNFYNVNLKKGSAEFKQQILTPGVHKINVLFESSKYYYSKVFYITVKKPTSYISLKTVKVKKSAKKLVLTATVKKINGKPITGKKITFKFNGKKYTAKTNKKGIAKVTIKKSVLKKLKAGKTVKYQATYQYTILKSAKITK